MYPFLRKNLQYLLRKNGLNPTSLSKLIKVSQPTLSRITSDKTDSNYRPDAEIINEIAVWAGVTTEELTKKDLSLLNKEELKIKTLTMADVVEKYGIEKSNGTFTNLEIEIYEDGDPIPEGYMAIDYYPEIRASAGNGYLNIEHGSPYKLYLPITEVLYYGANAESSKIFRVEGESMVPDLLDGQPISIDTSARKVFDGEIYAFIKNNELKIKYLFEWNDEGKGGFKAVSRNPDKVRYPDEYYSPSRIEEENIYILGQYWWKSEGRKVKR